MVGAPGIPACFESHETPTADPMTDTRTSLAILSDQLADAAASAGESIVAVHARPRLPSTGIHWQDGVVITTDGTVRRDSDITVTLSDGRSLPSTLAGRDRRTDLAVLRVAAGSLPTAHLGDPASLRPGHLVLALARLREGAPRVSFGAVSAVGGRWRSWKGGEIDRLLHSDLTLYPGFGGGPLVDSGGDREPDGAAAARARLRGARLARRRDAASAIQSGGAASAGARG